MGSDAGKDSGMGIAPAAPAVAAARGTMYSCTASGAEHG